MIRMIKYLVILFVVSFQMVARAQNPSLYINNLNQKSNRLQGKLQGEIYSLNVIGNTNYFLHKDWIEGTITLKDGDLFEGIRMRYLAYDDELVAYNDNNHSLFIVDKSTVKQFTLKESAGSSGFIERKFITLDSFDPLQNKTYFEELFSGSVKLLAFHLIEESKVRPYKDAYGNLSDTEYNSETLYYLFSDNKGLRKIRLRHRSLIKLYPEYKKEIRDFEIRYNMKSERFMEEFNLGKLGDKGEWFDWLYVDFEWY